MLSEASLVLNSAGGNIDSSVGARIDRKEALPESHNMDRSQFPQSTTAVAAGKLLVRDILCIGSIAILYYKVIFHSIWLLVDCFQKVVHLTIYHYMPVDRFQQVSRLAIYHYHSITAVQSK